MHGLNRKKALHRIWNAIMILVSAAVIVAALVFLLVLLTPVSNGEVGESATDRAAMVAAAGRYDEVLERTGDPFTADMQAQDLYIELGGIRDYWQGVAGE